MNSTNVIWKRPGFLLRRIHQIHVGIFLKECSDVQITPIQWGVLTIANASPGVGHIEISEELGLDRSNVANVVARLVRRGLLTQDTSPTDRRKKYIRVTDAGKDVMKDVEAAAQRAQKTVLNPLSDSEKDMFVDLLTRLVRENNHLGRAPLRLT